VCRFSDAGSPSRAHEQILPVWIRVRTSEGSRRRARARRVFGALISEKIRFARDSPLGSGFELVWGFSCQVVVLGLAESSLFGGVSR
jgi:hypothetical protein